jgi:hypothetical protein
MQAKVKSSSVRVSNLLPSLNRGGDTGLDQGGLRLPQLGLRRALAQRDHGPESRGDGMDGLDECFPVLGARPVDSH